MKIYEREEQRKEKMRHRLFGFCQGRELAYPTVRANDVQGTRSKWFAVGVFLIGVQHVESHCDLTVRVGKNRVEHWRIGLLRKYREEIYHC